MTALLSEMDKPILYPGDLPTEPKDYQAIWHRCAEAYVKSRLFGSTEQARDAAFEDVRQLYWSDEAAEYRRARATPPSRDASDPA